MLDSAVYQSAPGMQFNAIAADAAGVAFVGSEEDTVHQRVNPLWGAVNRDLSFAWRGLPANNIYGPLLALLPAGPQWRLMVGQNANDSFSLGGQGAFLLRTDLNGNYQEAPTFGGIRDEEACDIIRTADGRVAFCGYTNSYRATNRDYYLVVLPSDSIVSSYRLDSIFYADRLSPISVEEDQWPECYVFPNPASGRVVFDCQRFGKPESVRLFSSTGSETDLSNRMNGEVIDLEGLAPGIYFFVAESRSSSLHRKLVIR